ncbi:MAG: hypothetical protein ACREOJ_18495 [Gemmatimonadaceae bacterium]
MKQFHNRNFRRRNAWRSICRRWSDCSLFLCALVMFINACMCGNEVRSSAVAPDGRHVAVLFQRDCGATTGDNLELSLVQATERPQGGGNTFIVDAPARDSIATGSLVSLVTVHWISASALQVRYDRRLRVFRQETQVDGIAVSYLPQ